MSEHNYPGTGQWIYRRGVPTERLEGESLRSWATRQTAAEEKFGHDAPALAAADLSDPLVTSWMSGGEPVVVVTARMTGEGDEEFQSRHDEAVRFWQGIYPPDEQ